LAPEYADLASSAQDRKKRKERVIIEKMAS